jgi:hypothetical protein
VSEVQVYAVGAKEPITLEWAADIPSTSPITTISTVTYSFAHSTSPVELRVYDTDVSGTDSIVGLEGARHGHTYQCTATCTLSSGTILVKNFTVRGYNG